MKRTPLKKVSKKRGRQLSAYSKLRKEYMTANPVCEMCHKAKATDIHHKAGRVQEMLNEVIHWASVCRDCHNYIHQHPNFARDNGWLI